MSQNVLALRVDNSYNQFYYSNDGITLPSHNYQWSSPKYVMNNQPCDSDCYLTGATLIQAIQISYENLTPEGNHVTIHFEMNLTSTRTAMGDLSNLHPYLDNVNISSVLFYPNNGSGVVLNRETSSLNYAITPFTSSGGYKSETITFYGDITLSGVPTGSVGSFRINLTGAPNFILALPNDVTTITYIEQNPTSFIYSNNLNDALLSQQIAQTEVLIQLQTDLQSQQNQNTQDIINNQNQNTEDIIRSNQKCVTYDKTFTPSDINIFSTYLLESGDQVSFSGWGIIRYVSIFPNITYDFSFINGTGNLPSLCFYDENKSLISCIAYNRRNNFQFTSPANAKYLSLSIINDTSIRITVHSDEEVCTNYNEQYYNEQREADSNISSQSASDISGTENHATSNLIGVLSGFISAFSNINATNCNLTLEFPNYAGGIRVVNICQGKEKAPRIVEIGSSLLLIGVFVPLAYILIKMIYNEIRSWTNG